MTYLVGTVLEDWGRSGEHVGVMLVVPPDGIIQDVLVLLTHEKVLKQLIKREYIVHNGIANNFTLSWP